MRVAFGAMGESLNHAHRNLSPYVTASNGPA